MRDPVNSMLSYYEYSGPEILRHGEIYEKRSNATVCGWMIFSREISIVEKIELLDAFQKIYGVEFSSVRRGKYLVYWNENFTDQPKIDYFDDDGWSSIRIAPVLK